MDWLLSGVVMLSGQLRPHLVGVGTIIVSTLLVVYGNDINRAVKRLVSRQHLLLRYLTFILLCSVGYGLILLLCAPFITQQLQQLNSLWLAPIILSAFIFLGILAERKNHL